MAEVVALLQAHPRWGMVYGDANFIDAEGQVIGRFPARQTNYSLLRQGYVHIPQQAVFSGLTCGVRSGRSIPLLFCHGL